MKKKIAGLTLAIIMVVLNFSNTFSAGKFSDVQDSDWFNATVLKLVSLNIINGYPDGTFKPDGNIAVDEFIKSTVTALKYSFENGKDYWATPYINKAKELGLVKNGEFADYTKAITRAEMARIIVRALNESYPDNIDAYTSKLKDYDSISSDMKEYVLKAFVKGIVTGYEDKTFKPDNNATRAEASTIIIRMIDKVKRVIPILVTTTPKPSPKPTPAPTVTEVKLYKTTWEEINGNETMKKLTQLKGLKNVIKDTYNNGFTLLYHPDLSKPGGVELIYKVDYQNDSVPYVFTIYSKQEEDLEVFKQMLDIISEETSEIIDLYPIVEERINDSRVERFMGEVGPFKSAIVKNISGTVLVQCIR